ncbi:uncharacterized protein LOC131251579 [Magnolia sinica]|uniref:uncharacterized protein LOC131251579 n=1 Tax=Magnolia sinica TaxID=86752 RepID=UPI0026593204|nr:uncharacterized protein LOC131251579 [Magnolia sinica]
MLKHGMLHTNICPRPIFNVQSSKKTPLSMPMNISSDLKNSKIQIQRSTSCRARRRVRYEDIDEDEDEDYGHNVEIAVLESYSESAKDEVLLVRAWVDDHEEEVLIFKGFSSCLSDKTSADPSKSVLPARAVITSIDRIRGPFDPSNIEYLEKGLTWEAFKSRLC